MSKVIELDVDLDTNNIQEGVSQIINNIKPLWDANKITIEIQSGGIFNFVYKITDVSVKESLILKVFSPGSSQFVDQDHVYRMMKWVTENNYKFLTLHCKVNNGFFLSYFEGDLPTLEGVKEKTVIKNTFNLMHEMHQLPVPESLRAQNVDPTLHYLEEIHKILIKHQDFYKQHKSFIGTDLSWDKAESLCLNTIDSYKKYCKDKPLMLCHLDTRIDNIIFNRNTGDTHLVDWDFISVAPEEIDLCGMLYRDPAGKLTANGMLPALNEQVFDEWLTLYLESHPKYTQITQEIFDEWKKKMTGALDVMLPFNVVAVIALVVIIPQTTMDMPRASFALYDIWQKCREIFKIQ